MSAITAEGPHRRCSVEGCPEPHRAKGYCNTHYSRVLLKGDPGSAEIRHPRYGCEIDGCDKPHKAKGYCDKHYQRLQHHGDPTFRMDQSRENNPNWGGDDITYYGMHTRLKYVMGDPSEHECVTCGNSAHEWAYDHEDPEEKYNRKGHPYSTHLEHYRPMCRSCHRKEDYERRRYERLLVAA